MMAYSNRAMATNTMQDKSQVSKAVKRLVFGDVLREELEMLTSIKNIVTSKAILPGTDKTKLL